MRADDLMAKAGQALASAGLLLEAGDPDGACNRGYYAMFDAARACLLAAGTEIGKTHKGVLNAFSDQLIKNGPIPKEMGRLLKHAETRRYVADYEGEPVELEDARQMIAQAQLFVAAISTYLAQRGQSNAQQTDSV